MKVAVRDITIRNFRGIKEGRLRGLEQVNILIGKNNTGKSTILEAFYLVKAALTEKDQLGRDVIEYLLRRRSPGREKGLLGALWHGYKPREPILIELAFSSGDVLVMEIGLRADELRATLLLKDKFRETISRWTCYLWKERAKRKPKKRLVSDIPEERKEMTFARDALFLDVDAGMRLPQIEKAFWDAVLSIRADKKITAILSEAYGATLDGITYAPKDGVLGLHILLPKTSIRVDEMGDGFKQALYMLMAANSLENTLLMLEEPERHQHPGAMKVVLKNILSLAEKRDLQILISTHSLEFTNICLRLCRDAGLKGKIFHLSLSPDGLLGVRALRGPDAQVLADLGIDLRDLELYARGMAP